MSRKTARGHFSGSWWQSNQHLPFHQFDVFVARFFLVLLSERICMHQFFCSLIKKKKFYAYTYMHTLIFFFAYSVINLHRTAYETKNLLTHNNLCILSPYTYKHVWERNRYNAYVYMYVHMCPYMHICTVAFRLFITAALRVYDDAYPCIAAEENITWCCCCCLWCWCCWRWCFLMRMMMMIMIMMMICCHF